MQLAKRPAGLDAELLDQHAAGGLVGLERLSLPPRAVEREHQLRAEAFPQRMLADEPLQLGDQRAVPADGEVGLDALLQAHDSPLLEPGDLGLGKAVEHELRQRRPSPERQCFLQPDPRPQLLEARQVELVGLDAQR